MPSVLGQFNDLLPWTGLQSCRSISKAVLDLPFLSVQKLRFANLPEITRVTLASSRSLN
jgi:hypothetical protein